MNVSISKRIFFIEITLYLGYSSEIMNLLVRLPVKTSVPSWLLPTLTVGRLRARSGSTGG